MSLKSMDQRFRRLFGSAKSFLRGARPFARSIVSETTKAAHECSPERLELFGLELWGFYALGHRINNQKLHSSAMSLNQAAKQSGWQGETAVIRLSASPTDEEAPMIRALFGAMLTYGRLTRLLLDETDKDVAAFDE
jgi:hypothetical protein